MNPVLCARPFSGFAASALLACLLSACTAGTSSGISESAPPAVKPASGNAMLEQVRAAGQIGNELDVQPLRDPQVDDLRAVAQAAETRGDFAGAGRSLAQALALSPEDPDLLQWQAELALVARNWSEASRLATRSYERGPKLGGLCRRNWTTIALAAEAQSDAASAASARQRVAACAVPPPTRM